MDFRAREKSVCDLVLRQTTLQEIPRDAEVVAARRGIPRALAPAVPQVMELEVSGQVVLHAGRQLRRDRACRSMPRHATGGQGGRGSEDESAKSAAHGNRRDIEWAPPAHPLHDMASAMKARRQHQQTTWTADIDGAATSQLRAVGGLGAFRCLQDPRAPTAGTGSSAGRGTIELRHEGHQLEIRFRAVSFNDEIAAPDDATEIRGRKVPGPMA